MINQKDNEYRNKPSIVYSEYYDTANGKEVRFARILSKDGVAPFVEEMVSLANKVLPGEYDEIYLGYFLEDTVTSSSGKTYDVSNQWEGLSYLIFDRENSLVGFTVGNLSKESGATRGYSRITIVREDFQREGLGSYLIGLLGTSMIENGCQTMGGATELNNVKMKNLISTFGAEATVDGQFLRYEFEQSYLESFIRFLAVRTPHIDKVIKDLSIN